MGRRASKRMKIHSYKNVVDFSTVIVIRKAEARIKTDVF